MGTYRLQRRSRQLHRPGPCARQQRIDQRRCLSDVYDERMNTPKRSVAVLCLATLTVALIAIAVNGVSPSGTKVLGEQLFGSGSSFNATPVTPSQFTLDGSISGLYPDIPNKFLMLTVYNPNPVPIDVTSISVTAADATPTCTKANLVITNFSGHLNVPAKSSVV